jgi:hypothetical protein
MEEADVLSALESLSSRRRADGETAFPDWPTISDEIEIFARRRRISERRAVEQAEQDEWERRRRENPQDFVPVGDVWEEVKRKLAEKERAS